MSALVGDDDVAAYGRDGVTVLRGLFAGDWLSALRIGVERNLAEPGPLAGEHGDGEGKFSTIIATGSASPNSAPSSMNRPPPSSPRR